jgi:OFA family oxalate/formate antiporter-like MFS transporter
MKKHRGLMALAAVTVHLAIGSVYAYSVMTLPMASLLGWQKSDVVTAFSTAIFFLGMSAAFLGRFTEHVRPGKLLLFSAVLYSGGIFLSGLAVHFGIYPLFIAGYGVLSGIGLGLGYITPVTVLVKWFPDKKGFASGLVIMGFGFSAMVFGPLMAKLFGSIGIEKTFYALSAVYAAMILFSACMLKAPEPERTHDDHKTPSSSSSFSVFSAVFSKIFLCLWPMFFINICCGIALISAASPMAQERAGMTAIAAAMTVGVMGVFNGLGRFGWSALSDRFGRINVYLAFFVIQIPAYLLLSRTTHPLAFQIILFVIVSCYGGGFAVAPAFLGDVFGTRNLGRIYGALLTAWACAGVAGPKLAAFVREKTGSYEKSLLFFSGLLCVALFIGLYLKLTSKKESRSGGSK